MFSIKLKELYGSLTYSETRIINYILANKDNIDILTSENLAKEVGVSPSTITRFTQKFGYSSIRNLLLDFKNESDETSEVYEIQETESTDDTCKKAKSIYINSIESSYFNLDLTRSMMRQIIFLRRIKFFVLARIILSLWPNTFQISY